MNSSVKYTPKSLTENQEFIEHILSIIDTKLQYVEYHTRALIQQFNSPHTLIVDHPVFQGSNPQLLSRPQTDIDDKMFAQIEQYSKTTRLLLLMRRLLCDVNSSLTFELLSNDRYLNFEEKELKAMLNKPGAEEKDGKD